MATRPNFIDLRSQSQASITHSTYSKPLRSPRLHVAGEVPPELSPLDAFALQSRILARQLEETSKAGRRMSRLPPLTTESPVILQGRSDYFRSMSQDNSSEIIESPEQPTSGLAIHGDVEDELGGYRPVSMHPRMSRIPPTPDDGIPLPPQPIGDFGRGRTSFAPPFDTASTTFGARREQSPSPIDSVTSNDRTPEPRSLARDNSMPLPSPASPALSHILTQSPERLVQKNSLDSLTLAPPRAPFSTRRSSSALSSPLEPTDEECASGMSMSMQSLPPRKLSSSSAFSNPPMAPFQRSASVASDASSALPRPSFNFSRPLSRAGTPGLETPSRQTSSDSQPSFMFADDSASTPVSMHSEGFPDHSLDDGKAAASSYIYSKFSLPRGKVIQRSLPLDNQPQASYLWEQPAIRHSNVQPIPRGAPPSPPTRPSSSSGRGIPDPLGLVKPSFEQSQASMDKVGPAPQPSPNPSRPSTDGGRSSEDAPRGRSLTSPIHDSASRGRTPMSTTTSDSASTIKAKSQHSFAPSVLDMTADEHLAKGIECHENGSLNESTYHLRHAAKKNHPTAMLLYALACRHGWGMRPNQQEGVQWLKRAAECASLEIADDEDQVKEGKYVDGLERKTRKAQFALSIYELGVSHMNGWGIDQDKTLALRCFEIAGSE
jgi:hypothetical protein